WDYDTQWGADRSRSGKGPRSYGHLEFENTEVLLEVHAEYNVPACFAVVGSAALPGERPYHDREQVARIHAAGHEVGSHSFRHEWLPKLTRPELLETLRSSRHALEDCIGAEVTSFVPPFNQPYDYPAGWSFSRSERQEVKGFRTDLGILCQALAETGYRFCRVAHRSLLQRTKEWVVGRRIDQPSELQDIHGIQCARLNTPGGFSSQTRLLLEENLDSGGLWVVYGHPHSILEDGPQSIHHLRELLRLVADWRKAGRIQCVLPRQLTELSRG
ncbi:MAG: polysaccharide deacetylase family protein, partial [Acidobacteriota bacterium]